MIVSRTIDGREEEPETDLFHGGAGQPPDPRKTGGASWLVEKAAFCDSDVAEKHIDQFR